MKQTITKNDFTEAFKTMGRKDQFSYQGLDALFDYLEDYENDTGEEIELDVISLCCDFSEFDTALDAAIEYGFEKDEEDDREGQEEKATAYLLDSTTVIPAGDGIIIQNF